MAFLYVAEFSSDLVDAGGNMQIGRVPPLVEQKLDNTQASATGVLSAAFNTATRFVRLHTDSICSVVFNTTLASQAVNTSMRMAANQTEYFAVAAGTKLAVCVNT